MQIAKMKWFGYYIVIETGMEDGFLGGKGRPCRFVYIYIYILIYIYLYINIYIYIYIYIYLYLG